MKGRKVLRLAIVVVLAVAMFVASAGGARAEGPTGAASQNGAPVRIHDTVVFVIQAPSGNLSPEARAEVANDAVAEALRSESPDDVRVESRGDFAVLYAGKVPILNVTADDAALGGAATPVDHAAALAASLRSAMRSEQRRSAIADTVFSVSLAVLFSLVTLYLLRKTAEFCARARSWIAAHPQRIPSIQLKSLEIVSVGVVRSALDVLLAATRWVGQSGLLYAWLAAVLSLFESTRGYTGRLAGYVISPLSNAVMRIGHSLPLLLLAVVGVVVVIAAFSVVGTLFENVHNGQVEVAWMPRELARPTSLLLRIGLVAALVFVAPFLTGSLDGALARVGTIAVAVLGLASIPIVASAVVGISVIYLRRVPIGQIVELGGRKGRVQELSLLEVRLTDDDDREVRVPHLLSLVHPMRLLGTEPTVVIEISVAPSKPVGQLGRLLLDAAAKVGEKPSATLVRADASALVWKLSVVSSDRDSRARLYDAAVETVVRCQMPVTSSVTAESL